jgi:outer membrane biosynthesis protein TonB
MKKLAIVLLLASTPLLASCKTTRALARPIEQPALDVPPVPPRVVEPAPVEAPPPEPVPDLPPAPVAPPRQRPPARENTQREQAKPEAKPEAPPAEPAPATPPPATVPPLRTASAGDATEQEIRQMLSRAEGTLKQVDYGKLNEVRQKAYQDVQLFIKQADAALNEKNLVFARKLAEKAETMAKELLGR